MIPALLAQGVPADVAVVVAARNADLPSALDDAEALAAKWRAESAEFCGALCLRYGKGVATYTTRSAAAAGRRGEPRPAYIPLIGRVWVRSLGERIADPGFHHPAIAWIEFAGVGGSRVIRPVLRDGWRMLPHAAVVALAAKGGRDANAV